MTILEQLRQRLEEISLASQQILNAADADGRALNDDEDKQVDENTVEFDRVTREIAQRERVLNQGEFLAGSQGRRADPAQPAAARTPAPARAAAGDNRVFPAPRNVREQARGGFGSMGDFLLAVRRAAVPGQSPDPKLAVRQDTTTNFASENIGADGGFLVPVDFRNQLVTKVLGEESLLSRTDQITTGSNNVTMPVDENEPWNDSAGIFCRWENEGGTKPESKIELGQKTIRLNKLVALVPVSDELLEDAPAVEGYIRRKAPEKINWKVSRAILTGTGVGQPLGILNSGSKIASAAGSGPADTVQFAHIAQMYGRMYAPYRSNAVWLVHPEVEASFMTMFFSTIPVASVPATPIPVYLPANSVNGSPFGTLLGRPVIPTQACNPIGDEGDIIFADLSQYLSLIRTGAVQTDVSIHVYFVQDLTAFRFVLRVGGMPWWNTPISPRSGSFTQSAFITLAAR